MTAGVPTGTGSGNMTPAEREARWTLYVRFAIEAGSEDEARAVLDEVLAQLRPELPLRGQPVIHPDTAAIPTTSGWPRPSLT
jgi:hypothetical protein